jgi:hypothetical protein
MTVGNRFFGFMSDATCFHYLGCNAGFFGYDALTHFVCGIVIALGLKDKTKNLLELLAYAALIGVCWEILEFGYDHFRMVVLHMNLTNPNTLSQPSNVDTMGDLIFGLLGTFFGSMHLSRYIQTHEK